MANIVIHSLEFSNMFSYGAGNKIEFDKNRVTQLTAPNGSGKSSLSLILQEVLFNKNIKAIKKGDILNRWSEEKRWSATVNFSVDASKYTVEVLRSGAQTKTKLIKDGKDISEHRLPDTYKKIADILGSDFKVFSQLTYQSSTDLLEFLKATDANRKKFLIDLFNLEKYIEIGENIKKEFSEVDKQITTKEGELTSVSSFLSTVIIEDKREEIEVPEVDESLLEGVKRIDEELDNVIKTVQKIDTNKQYKKEIENIKTDRNLKEPDPFEKEVELEQVSKSIIEAKHSIAQLDATINELDTATTCPTCGQDIDNSQALALLEKSNSKREEESKRVEELNKTKDALSEEKSVYVEALRKYQANKKLVEREDELIMKIDHKLDETYPDTKEIKDRKEALSSVIAKQIKDRKEAEDYNKDVTSHNAKVDTLVEQQQDFKQKKVNIEETLVSLRDKRANLAILKKAFSTSGIVAFKLENLTKELEITINDYLSVLSDGQFQVEFSLEKEKLNISIINNGVSSPIETVSGGEYSRIQTSILLAIRSLLSKLGGSSINLLFLDEITGVLDLEGKEKLLEVLQSEENLNVFLISHDFEHPTVDKINIVKTNNISKIES